MPTRHKPPAPHPAEPPAVPPRRHGLSKRVIPPDVRAEPDLVARARGGSARTVVRPETVQVAPTAPTRIKVRAMRQGYYDHIRRHEGDVFYVENEQAFSAKWMERVAATTPERVTSAPEALRRAHDALLAERIPGAGTPLVHDEPDADKNPLGA